jgi:hypothetical protein
MMVDEDLFFETQSWVARTLFWGFLAIVLNIIGLAVGIYSAKKIGKGNKGYQIALSGVIIGVIGVILANVMSAIYFIVVSDNFFNYFFSYF